MRATWPGTVGRGRTHRLKLNLLEKVVAVVFVTLLVIGISALMSACDGFTVCSEIRKTDASLPILMLTARDSEQDKVKGLGLGADDYMTKPFSMMELFARIGALLRRSTLLCTSKASFMIGTARIDKGRMSIVDVQGRETPFAAREYELLKRLASHRGEVLARDRLLNELGA